MIVGIAQTKLVPMQIALPVGQGGGPAPLCCTSTVSVSRSVCARMVDRSVSTGLMSTLAPELLVLSDVTTIDIYIYI
uniref:Uncharacterized protein n=1 Tax=Anguilla anguilla TaxID=7936 RepID=A0A0E9S937_ANGAN